MADLSSDPSAALDSLAASLDTLDAQLAPILATKLQDLIAENEGEPLQVAKLHVMMVYLVHDLIWSRSIFLFCCVWEGEGGKEGEVEKVERGGKTGERGCRG